MKNKNGFTLTEILLAVMVVAIIGVSLASLTTTASREGGVGRSRTMLRNSMSRAIRQLRQDIQNASRVLYAAGPMASASHDTPVALLVLGENVRLDGSALPATTPKYTAYCFVPGEETTLADGTTAVLPTGSIDGGVVYRRTSESIEWNEDHTPNMCADLHSTELILDHVKFIPSSADENYPVPLFNISGYAGSYSIHNPSDVSTHNLASTVNVKLILELPANPVVNDVTEEIFMLPNGFTESAGS